MPSLVSPEVLDAADNGGDRASNGVTALPMGEYLTSDHVLLGSEFKMGKGGMIQGVKGAGHDVENNVPNLELDIAKVEWT